jgi:hypothetical protein
MLPDIALLIVRTDGDPACRNEGDSKLPKRG